MDMQVLSINIGKPDIFNYENVQIESGIFKKAVDEPIFLHKINFTGDGQADLIHHGGVDKAVCVYPFEHYDFWEKKLSRSLDYAAFGENLTVTGLLEQDVCIGDIYQLDEAVVQVTQPRQPCYKLAKRYNVKELPILVQESGFTGFYFRVLKEGIVRKEKGISLLTRHPMEITISFANDVMHHDKYNHDKIEQLLKLKELSSSWKTTFEKRLNGKDIDPKKRLEGIAPQEPNY